MAIDFSGVRGVGNVTPPNMNYYSGDYPGFQWDDIIEQYIPIQGYTPQQSYTPNIVTPQPSNVGDILAEKAQANIFSSPSGYPSTDIPAFGGSGFQPGISAEATAANQAAEEGAWRIHAMRTLFPAMAQQGAAGQASAMNLQNIQNMFGNMMQQAPGVFEQAFNREVVDPRYIQEDPYFQRTLEQTDPTQYAMVKPMVSGVGNVPLVQYQESGATGVPLAQAGGLVQADEQLMQQMAGRAAKQAASPFESALRQQSQSSYMRNPYGGAQTQSQLAGLAGRQASAAATAGSDVYNQMQMQNEQMRQQQLLADRDRAYQQRLADRGIQQQEMLGAAEGAYNQMLQDRGLTQQEMLSNAAMMNQQGLQDRALQQQMGGDLRNMLLQDIANRRSNIFGQQIASPDIMLDQLYKWTGLGLGMPSAGSTATAAGALRDKQGSNIWGTFGNLASAYANIKGN